MKIKTLKNVLRLILNAELMFIIILSPLWLSMTSETIEEIKRYTQGIKNFIIVHLLLYRNSSHDLYNIQFRKK